MAQGLRAREYTQKDAFYRVTWAVPYRHGTKESKKIEKKKRERRADES